MILVFRNGQESSPVRTAFSPVMSKAATAAAEISNVQIYLNIPGLGRVV